MEQQQQQKKTEKEKEKKKETEIEKIRTKKSSLLRTVNIQWEITSIKFNNNRFCPTSTP